MSRNQFKTRWFILQSSICKAGFVKLLAVFLLSTVIISGNAFAQYQPPSEGTPAAQRGERTEEYKESALRRFEVVTLISLPFTAIHSFLAVRGVKMIQNGNIAPELSSTDFKIVGVTAVSYALFIGFWDWLHTHGKNPSEQLIPTSPRSPTPATRKVPTTSWQIEDSPDFVLPLVQIRF